jgi:hypothetical protein
MAGKPVRQQRETVAKRMGGYMHFTVGKCKSGRANHRAGMTFSWSAGFPTRQMQRAIGPEGASVAVALATGPRRLAGGWVGANRGDTTMRLNRLAALVAAATLALSASPALAQDFLTAPLLLGVYECNDQALGRHKDLMFALLDDTT